MATNFPTGLDDFANYVDGTTIMEAVTLNDMQFAIEALQAKVGIDSSAVVTSHDYLLAKSQIKQVVNVQSGSYIDCTVNFPVDNTIPQNTEGTECMTLAITPTDASNKLKIEVVFQYQVQVNNIAAGMGLFQDSTVNALAAAVGGQSNYDNFGAMVLTHYMTAGTTSETTFKVRGGGHSADIGFNGLNSRIFGGVSASSITITEIQG